MKKYLRLASIITSYVGITYLSEYKQTIKPWEKRLTLAILFFINALGIFPFPLGRGRTAIVGSKMAAQSAQTLGQGRVTRSSF